MLAALKVMHAAGLVHRDIKPANIMQCVATGSDDKSRKDSRKESLRHRLSSPSSSRRGSLNVSSFKDTVRNKPSAPLDGASSSGHARSGVQDAKGKDHVYKLIDFGTAVGIDDTIAGEEMMTMAASRQMGAGTPPYMSPEMFKEPDKARCATPWLGRAV